MLGVRMRTIPSKKPRLKTNLFQKRRKTEIPTFGAARAAYLYDCFGAFSYQPGSDTRPTNVGDTADFSFSDKPANGVFHYFSSGKTDQKSSEALYDEINITGKNYNSGILAVDNMPVVKKYITDNYRTDLKQAVKKQLQDLYKTRPEAWEENKKRVREEIIKQFGISEDVFNKLQQKMPQKINFLIEEQVLTPYILRP